MIHPTLLELSAKLDKIESFIENEKVYNIGVDIANAPEHGSRWVRKDNVFNPDSGGYNGYFVLYVTNTEHIHTSHPPQVVYEGDNGHIWSLPLSEWPGNLEKEEL